MAPVTMFYGIPVHSTKVIFIIDTSLSFQWTAVQGAQSYYLYVGTTVGAFGKLG